MNTEGSVHPKSVDNLGNALACELGVVHGNGVAGNSAEPRPIHGYMLCCLCPGIDIDSIVKL